MIIKIKSLKKMMSARVKVMITMKNTTNLKRIVTSIALKTQIFTFRVPKIVLSTKRTLPMLSLRYSGVQKKPCNQTIRSVLQKKKSMHGPSTRKQLLK